VLHIAIIGSGPAGYYTAEAAQKNWSSGVRVDIFDRLPVPYGLIRSGVAPDHQSIKGVSRRYEAVSLSDNIRFIGNVSIGQDISIEELQSLYDAVVLATGAPHDKALGLDGEHLPNVFGSAAFVGWYNGHPQFADLAPDLSGRHAVVIGNGNVALDVARILAKTREEFAGSDIAQHALDALQSSKLETITLLGRRGPHQIAMTPKELGELGHLQRACPRVDAGDLPDASEDMLLEPGQRKSVTHLRGFAAIPESHRADKDIDIPFDFFAAPTVIVSDTTVTGVTGVTVERTKLDGGRAVGTGEHYTLPASIVIACIGYQTSPIPGVPFEESAGRFANDEGRIMPGLYCVGWARRGPSGTIGTNRPDGFSIIEKIAQDVGAFVGGKEGGAGFDKIAAQRNLAVVTFRDWQKIDEAEMSRARDGAPREKFVAIAEMIAATGKS
jgi:ferredoxin--NADP+ reductase